MSLFIPVLIIFALWNTQQDPNLKVMATTSNPRFRTWPITAVRSLRPKLQEMGLRIPPERIDGTTTPSASSDMNLPPPLSDALVSVGPAGRGGTGSFVSADGLILTNWHVAYDAVRQASLQTKGVKDYVRDGFVSKSREEELEGPNYEVWITKRCVDCSDQVLAAINKCDDTVDAAISEKEDPLLERANRIRNIMQEIAQQNQKDLMSKEDGEDGTKYRCDVQEMLPNESYVLFTYQRIRDVRIVYVPPKSLGNFGGDIDNFEWPRHTADFALLRAYVGPNGEAGEYSPENVPFKSNARIQVEKDGAQEGEMVFVLGFPGRTMRYAPTSRLSYSDDVAVPSMVKDFARKLQLIDQYEQDSSEAALKLGTSKKSLANEYKRSQGKLIMVRKLGLIQERKLEEEELCRKFPEAKEALNRLAEIYDEFRKSSTTSTALEACRGIYAGSALLAAGHSMHEYLVIEQTKPDDDREASYRQRNLPFLFKRLNKRLGDVHVPHEVALVKDAIATLSGTSELDAMQHKVKLILDEKNLTCIVEGSKLKDPEVMDKLLAFSSTSDEDDLESETAIASLLEDPFIKCAAVFWDTYKENRDISKGLISERDILFAKLLEFQRKVSPDEVMYPDCNGSLRISAGHVEGYQAADAIVHQPSTTLAGLYDKVTEAKLGMINESKFTCPGRLYNLLSSSASSDVSKVPVCLLYSTDTVGGNSGSPVMNADGKFVGINFDRQRQGLMNEYKWSKDYSRSIGVDIRYILWLIGDYDGAGHLVEEMLS